MDHPDPRYRAEESDQLEPAETDVDRNEVDAQVNSGTGEPEPTTTPEGDAFDVPTIAQFGEFERKFR
ncbi:hypothetical protein F4553_001045 [Allocatelliglobosispora scoriae]|uniref:Uncharacterized protein n=1 Tax=Allocatelliglobosispora scoriae TaxID=643052 RepID=A0A841BKB3_9ACTN|nr:hypothetical protein [Allocatelliglobosispora scoriae]MBB5867666.1 hypothetical protein [Allocatelliglobosispora scoriae]